jgi:glycosyltransferase involved in cell wall biosynthesis
MISILILTKNEQRDISECIASVAWSDDIHVFDSNSTDDTVSIAENCGAKITKRAFDNWSAHQNWGLNHISFKYSWVFYIDADERMTPNLANEIRATVTASPPYIAYRVQRRDFFWGTWLKHAQATPFYTRLFRPERIRYERLVNPVCIADGPVGQLSCYLDHFPFKKGVTHWLDRHNSYSSFEAMQIVQERKGRSRLSIRKALTAPDFHERRYHQKQLFYRLPMRPLIKFFGLYIGRGGFLDGYPGFTYSVLQAIYEYMIVLKVREIRMNS